MGDPRRTYFGTDSTPFVQGPPRVKGVSDIGRPCPHCQCATLYDIEVTVAMPLLTTGKGVGHYVGCPACPFASPMLMVAGEEP